MNKATETNNVRVSGMIATELVFSHSVMGEKFYTFSLEVKRKSDNVDLVPVTVSDRLVLIEELEVGAYISVCGSFRSYNKHTENGNHLILSVFADEVAYADEGACDNEILIDGYLCKEPVHRVTPLGREIGDLLIAVNRAYGKSDYLPCVCWGRNAGYAGTLSAGTHIAAKGRIQSRVFLKGEEERTAYEVSLNSLQLI